jgi:hypothetical protein
MSTLDVTRGYVAVLATEKRFELPGMTLADYEHRDEPFVPSTSMGRRWALLVIVILLCKEHHISTCASNHLL